MRRTERITQPVDSTSSDFTLFVLLLVYLCRITTDSILQKVCWWHGFLTKHSGGHHRKTHYHETVVAKFHFVVVVFFSFSLTGFLIQSAQVFNMNCGNIINSRIIVKSFTVEKTCLNLFPTQNRTFRVYEILT